MIKKDKETDLFKRTKEEFSRRKILGTVCNTEEDGEEISNLKNNLKHTISSLDKRTVS